MARKPKKRALIFWGGWLGHEPEQVSAILARQLRRRGCAVDVFDSQEPLMSLKNLRRYDLIVPAWTMGTIDRKALQNVLKAARGGVGVAGVHGGMGDAFRQATEWQFMVGGQWVAHPGGIIKYRVHILDHADPVTAGLGNFDMKSEQYYMHTDPSNHVLATTTFEFNGCTMPVAWKRMWGKGRVFYSSLGHVAADFKVPEALTIITRGMLWAARAE